MHDWPRLPIRPEALPKIPELLTAEEYEKLLKRLGGLATSSNSCAGHERVPNTAGTPGAVACRRRGGSINI